MFEIPVYAVEKENGLDKLIKASASVAFACEVQLAEKFELADRTIAKLRNLGIIRTVAGTNDFDLHYLKTILVTAGVWNKNDDIFDTCETWVARATPEDKPFNYEHNGSDIIGHIVGSTPIDDAGKSIADDTALDLLPAKFHLATGAVLYKYWEKPELQERMDKILAEIAKSEWFVSMEALFKGFDYGIKDANGVSSVVARNEKTAYLTKHLRAYGGDGTYNGQKVGRVLRNIVFSGKGLVRKPANPESIIFAAACDFVKSQENISRSETEQVYSLETKVSATAQIKESNKMTEIEILQKKLDDKIAECETLKASQSKAQIEALQGEMAAKAEEVKSLTAAKQDVDSKLAEADKALKAAQASAEETQKKHNEVVKQLDAIKAEQKKATRIAAVKAALKTEETDAEGVKSAVELAESLFGLSDEAFDAAVKAMAKFTPAKLPPKSTPGKEAPKATNKPAPMAGKAAEDEGAANASTDQLETPEVETDAALSTASTDSGVEITRKHIHQFFGVKAEEQSEE